MEAEPNVFYAVLRNFDENAGTLGVHPTPIRGAADHDARKMQLLRFITGATSSISESFQPDVIPVHMDEAALSAWKQQSVARIVMGLSEEFDKLEEEQQLRLLRYIVVRPSSMTDACRQAIRVCAYCGEPARLLCAACRSVRYCDISCQRKHWKECHKGECQL